MARARPLAPAAALALLLGGCATEARGGLYAWGGYDAALFARARAPQDDERYLEALRQIVERAEAERGKAPPGIYAEYGYALFAVGRLADAVTWYRKERDTWPESQVFMEKMIRNTLRLQEARPPSPRDGPAPPPPGTSPDAPPEGSGR